MKDEYHPLHESFISLRPFDLEIDIKPQQSYNKKLHGSTVKTMLVLMPDQIFSPKPINTST